MDADEQTIQDLSDLADAGELAGPLAHEVNNFLNVLLLNPAVLLRDELAEVRRQGKQLGKLVERWQRSRGAARPRAVDVGKALQRLDLSASPVTVRTETAFQLPAVLGVPTDVYRLLGFLVKHAVAAAAAGEGTIRIQAKAVGEKVQLRVEDTGSSLSREELAQIFEPCFPGRPGTDSLELAACWTIVKKRLNGTITAENLPGGGIAIVVELLVA